jgi:hypothetical protein
LGDLQGVPFIVVVILVIILSRKRGLQDAAHRDTHIGRVGRRERWTARKEI